MKAPSLGPLCRLFSVFTTSTRTELRRIYGIVVHFYIWPPFFLQIWQTFCVKCILLSFVIFYLHLLVYSVLWLLIFSTVIWLVVCFLWNSVRHKYLFFSIKNYYSQSSVPSIVLNFRSTGVFILKFTIFIFNMSWYFPLVPPSKLSTISIFSISFRQVRVFLLLD